MGEEILAVDNFLVNSRTVHSINYTNIMLLTKFLDAKRIEDYMPVAPCNRSPLGSYSAESS